MPLKELCLVSCKRRKGIARRHYEYSEAGSMCLCACQATQMSNETSLASGGRFDLPIG